MTRNSSLIVVGFAAVLAMLAILYGAAALKGAQTASAAGFQMTVIGSTATSSTVTSVTSSARVMATSTDGQSGYTRVYAALCNVGAVSAYIRLDGDKAVNINTAGAIPLAVGACYYLNDQNMYQGSITASSTGAATTISAIQYVQ